MCQLGDDLRKLIVDTDAEGGQSPDGKAWLFGTRAFMKALGIPTGNAVNRIIIDVQHNAFVQVYVCQGGGFPNGAEPLMELLSRLAPQLVHETPPAEYVDYLADMAEAVG